MRPRPRLSPVVLALLGLAPGLAAAAPVSGRLAAPAGSLPALTLYAWSLTGAGLYSVMTTSGQASFAIDLPAGRYYVFAAPADPGAPALYGAYTEFAACSRGRPRDGACPGHVLRTVVVRRAAVDGVDLTDWYLDDAVTRELDRILGRPADAQIGESELAAPKFSEYPAPPAGAVATALAAEGDARIERDREVLTAALGSGANFAGRTVLVKIGCGAGCESVAFVDLPSGRVAFPAALATLPAPTDCAGRGPLQFRRDSRLLTVTGRDGDQLLTRYFVWEPDSGALRLAASLASAVSERCGPVAPGR
jgi:hypothetical protein